MLTAKTWTARAAEPCQDRNIAALRQYLRVFTGFAREICFGKACFLNSIDSDTTFIKGDYMYKIGIGYDIHKLVEDRKLIIGGVNIPYDKGLLGHSDADVLIHAIIDALLGASGMPDIGTLFPDTDYDYKNADSLELLKQVMDKVSQKGYGINNLDTNIIAQRPQMAPYIPLMKEKLSDVLKLNEENISIKAKTKENLDAVGECLAIEAQAVVLLTENC